MLSLETFAVLSAAWALHPSPGCGIGMSSSRRAGCHSSLPSLRQTRVPLNCHLPLRASRLRLVRTKGCR